MNTVAEQPEVSTRTQSSKFVPAVTPESCTSRRQVAPIQVEMNVPTAVTAYAEMKTNAQDRAWGFLIASTPRTFAFAFGTTMVAIAATEISAVGAIALMFIVFAVAEIALYRHTLDISIEGTANYEVKQKWQVIKREQEERWKHY